MVPARPPTGPRIARRGPRAMGSLRFGPRRLYPVGDRASPGSGPGWWDYRSTERTRTMKGKRFSNEQIIYALKRVEAGEKAREVCRQMGVSEPTFYLWKKKFSGMGVSELARLRQLEEENNRLKRLVADLSLDKHILQEVVAKKL